MMQIYTSEKVMFSESLGDSLRQLAKYEESLDAYDKALQIDPKLILAIDGKGIIKTYL